MGTSEVVFIDGLGSYAQCPRNPSDAVALTHIDYQVPLSELSLNLCVSSEALSRLLSHGTMFLFFSLDRMSRCPFS